MKKFMIVLFVMFASFAVLAQPSLDDLDNDTKKVYNEGIQLSKEGKYRQAVDKFDVALKSTNNYLVYMQKGTALQKAAKNVSSAEREGFLKDAIVAFEKCFDTYPDYDLAYFKIGAAYFSLGDYEKAVEFFEKMKATTKNNKYKRVADKNIAKAKEKVAYPFLVKANEELSRKRFDNAIENFNKVLEYTNSDVAFLGLADAYSEKGMWQESLDAAENANTYRKSIPKGGPSYYMGHAFAKMGETQKAITHFEDCINDRSSKNTYKARASHELEALKK